MSSGSTQTQTQSRKRFINQENRDLEDLSDPHTLEDETATPVRDHIRKNWRIAAFGAIFGLIALVIFVAYTRHLYPELVGNIWVRRFVVVGTLVGVVGYMADQRRLGMLSAYQWLTLDTEEGPICFIGEANMQGTPTFKPYKGFDRFGRLRGEYTVEEVNEELPDTISNTYTDPNDPARIRLHPVFADAAQTDRGLIVMQETTELQPDHPASEATHYAPEPELIREDVSEELKQTIKQEREEVQELRDEIQMMQRRLEDAKENGAMTTEDMMDEFLELYERIELASRRSRTSYEERKENGDAPVGQTAGQTIESVEQEVSPDDDG